MSQEKKVELLSFSINRYDQLYDAVNNKANVFLGLLVFLMSAVVTCFFNLTNTGTQYSTIRILVIICVSLQMTGILFILFALKPYLKGGSQQAGNSLLFFGDVSWMTKGQFMQAFNNADDNAFYLDLQIQVYQLASGLRKKYRVLSIVTYILCTQLLLIGTLITMLIYHHSV